MTDSRATTRRQKLALVAGGLLVVPVALLSVELVLATLGIGPERFDDPYVGFESSTPLFVEGRSPDGTAVYRTSANKLEFFNEQSFPVEKREGALRIFALGGSTTAGRPYDDHLSFARWLERWLEIAEPEAGHRVINAGAVSYASYRIVILMRELAELEPDVFVVYTGHNEFLEERTYREFIDQPALLKWIRTRLGRFRSVRLLQTAVAGSGTDSETDSETSLQAEVSTRLDVWEGIEGFERDEELARSIVEHFRFNLEQMVEIAATAGAELIFIQPASNLKDFSPFRSQASADLGPGEERRFAEHLERGRALLESDPETAARELEAAVGIDPKHADALYLLGRALLADEDIEGAREALREAREQDVAPLRGLLAAELAVDEVVARHGLTVVAIRSLLEEESRERHGHDLLGDEQFLDHVHPDTPVHSRIAVELMAALRRSGLVERAAPPDAIERIYRDVLAGLDRAYYAQRDLNLGKVLGWAGKFDEAAVPLERAATVLPENPDLRLHLGALRLHQGRLAEAEAELELAVELAPDSAEAWFNLGVSRGRLSRPREGLDALEEALRLRPDYPEAEYNRGVLYRALGDDGASSRALARANRLSPGSAAALHASGLTHAQAGRLDEAVSAYRRSLAVEESVRVRIDLAAALAESGRHNEARDELEAVLSTAPENVEAHYTAGRLAADLAVDEEAEAHYRSALEGRPDHIPALNNLAILVARQGRLSEALRLLDQAIDIDGTDSAAHFNRGIVLDQAERPAEAIHSIQRARDLEPGNGRIRLALALLYLRTGRQPEARTELEAARSSGEPIPAELAGLLEPSDD